MQQEGSIRHVGLSNVGVADIEEARKFFEVATVQNRYNLGDRVQRSRARLLRGERHRLHSLVSAGGRRSRPRRGRRWTRSPANTGASHGQIALAWMLKRSPVMLPIPGTGKVAHLEDNVAAAGVELSQADFEALDAAGRAK